MKLRIHRYPENAILQHGKRNLLHLTHHLCTMVHQSLQKLCKGIRNNDPSITKVMLLLNRGKWLQLLKALQRNTKVMSLHLHGGGPINVALDFSSLLKYLKQSNSIRELNLSIGHPYLLDRVLQSLAENQFANLVAFESKDRLPCHKLLELIQANSHHLKRLSIYDIDVPPDDDERCRQVSAAIESLPILESLSLGYEALNYISLELLSGRMKSHTHLRKLRLGGMYWRRNRVVMAALRRQLCSGVQLQALELQNFALDQEMIEHLVQGLASCKTLAHLSLEDCTFPGDSVVASRIIRFLQSSQDTRNESSSARTASLSSFVGSSSLVVHYVLMRKVADVSAVDVIDHWPQRVLSSCV
jgi:hypothetical protein